jgi:hypothetical protein
MSYLICNKCGGEAGVRGSDSIDWCEECGIVEGNVTVVQE